MKRAFGAMLVAAAVLGNAAPALATDTIYCQIRNSSDHAVKFTNGRLWNGQDPDMAPRGRFSRSGTVAAGTTWRQGYITIDYNAADVFNTEMPATAGKAGAKTSASAASSEWVGCSAEIGGSTSWGKAYDPEVGKVYLKWENGNVEFSEDPYTITLEYGG